MSANDTVRYIGELKDQTREGFGVYQYENKFFRYEGEWHAGKKHGFCRAVVSRNGTECSNHSVTLFAGHGKLVMKDGSYYEGEFHEGEIQGHGTKKWSSSGNFYTGEFEKGECCGFGVMQYGNGSRYEGEWLDNAREGNGTLTEIDGAKYIGSFHGNKRHGEGKQIDSNGDHYEGDWVAGMRHGHGIMKFADGSIYGGQWRSNQFHGQGSYIHCSGCSYEGIWRSGRPEVEATRLVITLGPDIEIGVDDLINLEVECRSSEDDTIPETGRLLQVVAGVRVKGQGLKSSSSATTNTRDASTLDKKTEEEEEDSTQFFSTPFGFEVKPYPLLEVAVMPARLDEETAENLSDRDGGESMLMEADKTSIIQDSVRPAAAPHFQSEDLRASKNESGTTNEVEREFTSRRYFPSPAAMNPLLTTEYGENVKECSGHLSNVPPVRVVNGSAVFEGLYLPSMGCRVSVGPLSPDLPIFKEKDVKEKGRKLEIPAGSQAFSHFTNPVDKKRASSQIGPAEVDRSSEKGRETRDKKKREKKEEKIDKEEKKNRRPVDFVLVVKDVTEPPFLDTRLEPAFLHVRIVTRPKRNSRIKT